MARRCGDCQLCCKLLPTPEIGSLANERCKHQKHGVGCAIYARRPMSCRLWSCGWLQDGFDVPRPDRSHYVIDMMPDYITLKPNDGSAPTHIPVVQVWVDPDYKDAHKAPSFRAWLDRLGMPAIIRFNSRDGFVLFPPSTNTNREWREEHSSMAPVGHTLEQKMAALGGTLEMDTSQPPGAAYAAKLSVGGRTVEIAAVQAPPELAVAALRDAAAIIEQRAAKKAEP